MKWRLGIAGKLALVLALVGALAAGSTGYYVYQASRSLLVASAERKLLTSTQVVLRRISQTREAVSGDLKVLTALPDTLKAVQHPDEATLTGLRTLFAAMIQANPAYLQVRLIAAHSHGLEVVRVDRDSAGPLPVTGDDLQEKGHFAYVAEALRLGREQTYLSRIAINHERGAHLGEGKPSVVLAMPLMAPEGRAVGVVAINVDLGGLFDLLRADLPPQFQLFLANGAGDILVHPNPELTFGFDRGQRELLQTHMPPTLALVESGAREAVFELSQGSYAEQPVVAAFVRAPVSVASGEQSLLLGLAQPLSGVLAEVEALRRTIVQIVVGTSLACLVLAMLLARALSRPINAIGSAASLFARGGMHAGLPTGRSDEIGDLARSFSRMQQQIAQHMTALQASRAELSELARHDVLTGLANRRLFEETLQAALAHHRRTGEGLALLFVDLDRFKDINDGWGHDTGDAVLRTVAHRLRDTLREVDTPARLGGDEFVVLLGAAASPGQLAVLARKLHDALAVPIVHDGHSHVVGCSIGISRCPENGDTPEALLAAADMAMYEVKQAGRNGHRLAPAGGGGADRCEAATSGSSVA